MRGTWKYMMACLKGLGHVKDGLPCQDACTMEFLGQKHPLAAVGDGAGSASKSNLGSQMAVKFATESFLTTLLRNNWALPGNLPSQWEWENEAEFTLRAVKGQMEEYAFMNGIELSDLATTLMIAYVKPDGIMFCHVGDGRGAYKMRGEEWRPLFEPVEGVESNATMFLTGPWDQNKNWWNASIVQGEVESLALLTDGCEQACFQTAIELKHSGRWQKSNIPFSGFFDPVVDNLVEMSRLKLSQDEIDRAFAEFLDAGTEPLSIEEDDKTMIILSRKEPINEHL